MNLYNQNPVLSGLAAYGQMKGIQNNQRAMEMREEQHASSLKDSSNYRQQQEGARQRQQENQAKVENQNKAFMLLGNYNAARLAGLDPQYSDEDLEFLSKNKTINPSFLLGDEVGKALEVADGVKNKKIDIGSPEAAQALNTLFPEVQKGSPGKKKIHTAGVGPSNQHLVFGLDVDGQPKPMTVGRDSNPNAEIMQVPFEDVMGRVTSIQQMRQMLSTEKGQKYLQNLYYQHGGKRVVPPKPKYSNIQRLEDGSMAGINSSTSQYERIPSGDMAFAKPSAKTQVDVNISDGSQPLTKSNTNKVQNDILAAQKALRDLNSISDTHSDEFLTNLGRVKAWTGGVLDRMGQSELGLSQFNAERTKFATSARQFFNAYKKEITGAAASEKEMQMLLESMFNEKMGPAEFRAAFETFYTKAEENLRAKQKVAIGGLDVNGSPARENPLQEGNSDASIDDLVNQYAD